MAGSVDRPGSNSPGSSSACRIAGNSSTSSDDKLGRILGEVRIVGEDRGDRFADVAHAVRSRTVAGDRAPSPSMRLRRKSIGGMSATSAAVHTACTPGNASAAPASIARNRAVRKVRADDAHMQLPRKRYIGGKAAAAGQERPVLEARQRASDIFCLGFAAEGAIGRSLRSAHAVCRRISPATARERPSRCSDSRCSGTGWTTARRRAPSSLMSGSRSSTPVTSIRKPGVQKPHCRP